MARLLGRPTALDLILFSRRLTPAEALEIGLVDRVFPEGGLMNGTMEYARDLAKRAPLAVSSVLEGMITGIEKGIDEGLKVDRACSARLPRTPEKASWPSCRNASRYSRENDTGPGKQLYPWGDSCRPSGFLKN